MTDKISRRRFLTLAAGAVGATALSCGGVAVLGTRQLPVELAQARCTGEDPKILVAYASRCGSTSGVAQAIGQAMCEGGATVDVLPLKTVQDLAPYSAAVVGSAVRIGQWLSESKQFVQSHQARLADMPRLIDAPLASTLPAAAATGMPCCQLDPTAFKSLASTRPSPLKSPPRQPILPIACQFVPS